MNLNLNLNVENRKKKDFSKTKTKVKKIKITLSKSFNNLINFKLGWFFSRFFDLGNDFGPNLVVFFEDWNGFEFLEY